jgi:hypothetical protein
MRLWRTTEHEKLPTLVASLLLSIRAPALFIAAALPAQLVDATLFKLLIGQRFPVENRNVRL